MDGSNSWRGLYGRTAGIIGMGNNGRMVADRLRAFGMRLAIYDRRPICWNGQADLQLCKENGDPLDPVLEQSDFLILTTALTDETWHMINRESLRKMKNDAFLVNIARGGIVCTEDLVWALEEHEIGGAGLDVVEQEPLPADHPLWYHPNVYITPHCTPQVPHRAGRSIEIIRGNARRFEADEPLLNLMRQQDAMTGSGEKTKSGWARMMNSGLSKEQIEKMDLEKYLGVRGWSDPSEWM